MDKEKAKEYYNYLDRKYTEWYCNPKQRPNIEADICKAAVQWDVDIYAHLNDSRATGLFEHGFFQSDIQKAFSLLKELIDKK